MNQNQQALIPLETPGEILKEEFMEPHGLSINALAKDLAVDPMRISHIVNGQRSITANTALRLSRFFGNSARFWLNLQADYDLRKAMEKNAELIEKEITPISA